MQLPYNPENKDSIIQFAKKFIGKSIQSEFEEELKKLELSNNDKGQLGKVIEKLYFQYEPNSNAKADFEQAGLELKSSGLKQLKNKEYRAKERLVLNIINYINAVDHNFEDDFINGKNGHLLLIFYLYAKGLNQLASEIRLVGDWKYPREDIEIIKKDWLKIQNKIKEGKAHELSEGDTFYLGACTKGANASTVKKQPYSDIPAKQRAYSLKPGYVNHIIASIANETEGVYGKLISNREVARLKTIEEIVLEKFSPFFDKSIAELIVLFNLEHLNPNAKSYFSLVSKAILNNILKVPSHLNASNYFEEFRKAEIEIKAIRVELDNKIIESVSSPAFEYIDFAKETWEDSKIKDFYEKKFLFIFYKQTEDGQILQKVKFWNMPYEDIIEAKKVWRHTRRLVKSGTIVQKVNTNGTRKTNFLGKNDNRVSHVRPHAKNSADTYPLPKRDVVTQAKEYTKYCFWLNNDYIRDEIYLK